MVFTRGDRKRKEMAIDGARQNSTTDQKYSTRLEEVPVSFASPWSVGLQKTPARFRQATRILNPTVKPDVDFESLSRAAQTDNDHSHHHRLDVPLCQEPQESQLVALQPEKNTTSHVTTSFNITEFARKEQDGMDEDDDDEVESVLNPAFDYVEGCRVKKEHVPLVRAIFDKYGDITWECQGKPPAIVSFFLERVCIIYEKLKETKFAEATGWDLNQMLDEVEYLESEKLDLGWLHKKLQHICETKTSFRNYLTFKEEGKRSDAIITTLENEMEANRRHRRLLEDKMVLLEDKMIAEKAKSDEIKNKVRDIKVRVDHLWTHSLVDGLL